jgi:hypothetical protein
VAVGGTCGLKATKAALARSEPVAGRQAADSDRPTDRSSSRRAVCWRIGWGGDERREGATCVRAWAMTSQPDATDDNTCERELRPIPGETGEG